MAGERTQSQSGSKGFDSAHGLGSSPEIAGNGLHDLLPRVGETHDRLPLGLPHGAAMAIEGSGVSGSLGQAPSMDHVRSGQSSLSLSALRAAKTGLRRELF